VYRDIRDPETIGKSLIELHRLSPSVPITTLADQYLQEGTAHRWYGESEKDYHSRIYPPDPFASGSNGKLAA
jgi:hypothetical protein